MKRSFNKPRITTRDLNMRVSFYQFAHDSSPLPNETQVEVLKTCWAKVDSVWERDLEQAKSNDTVRDVKIKIRDFRSEFQPTEKQKLTINHQYYANRVYEIVSVNPDETEKDFILVVAKLVE